MEMADAVVVRSLCCAVEQVVPTERSMVVGDNVQAPVHRVMAIDFFSYFA